MWIAEDLLMELSHVQKVSYSNWFSNDSVVTFNVSEYKYWTVHAIQAGRRSGTYVPKFCNQTRPLDIDKIRPLIGNLTLAWTNLDGNIGNDTFWSSLWYQYGSCFRSWPFNLPFNYFSKGKYIVTSFTTYNHSFAFDFK